MFINNLSVHKETLNNIICVCFMKNLMIRTILLLILHNLFLLLLIQYKFTITTY